MMYHGEFIRPRGDLKAKIVDITWYVTLIFRSRLRQEDELYRSQALMHIHAH